MSGPSLNLTVRGPDGREWPMDQWMAYQELTGRKGPWELDSYHAGEVKKGAVDVGQGIEYYEPVPIKDTVAYGQQTWSPMISTSYPGMFWDPATGKMSTQAEIMSRLNWPTLGGIPYQYNPPRPRGFMGMQYPLFSPETDKSEEEVRKQVQVEEMEAAVITLGILGLAVGVIFVYDKYRAKE